MISVDEIYPEFIEFANSKVFRNMGLYKIANQWVYDNFEVIVDDYDLNDFVYSLLDYHSSLKKDVVNLKKHIEKFLTKLLNKTYIFEDKYLDITEYKITIRVSEHSANYKNFKLNNKGNRKISIVCNPYLTTTHNSKKGELIMNSINEIVHIEDKIKQMLGELK